jgi:Fur family transcriptional regulator, ferric uptake regulator
MKARKKSFSEHTAAAEAAIRATSERLTQPRVAVLAALLSFDHAVSHTDVATALASETIDRVTVYRVLDWLVSVGIAHRISGDDRVWRFMLNASANHRTASRAASRTTNSATHRAPHESHAHFTCEACGQTFCLEAVKPKMDLRVPEGFRTSEVDVKLRGRCAHCA